MKKKSQTKIMFLSIKMAKNEKKFRFLYVFDVIYGFLRLKTICVPKFDPVGSVELTLSRKTSY